MKTASLLREPPSLEQGFNLGLGTPEPLVERHGIFGSTSRQDVLSEGFRGCLVKEAGLLERLESVRIEHLGPDVAIVARRVSAGKDVVEIGAPISDHDLRE